MKIKVEKAAGTGFCFGVKRTINILEKSAADGPVETLRAVVHNKQVLQKLADCGVTVTNTVEGIKGKRLAIGAHGVGPDVIKKINDGGITIIDTTCRSVHRAQQIAEKFSRDGFFIVVYGDAEHPEVKGILSWADNKGIATRDADAIAAIKPFPNRIGVLAQTTSVPQDFIAFVKDLFDKAFIKNSEIHVVDTICHDIRQRQNAAQKLARRVDLMFVVGDRTSANTNRLAELCSKLTKTYLIETADELKTTWLKGHKHIGVTGGASTAEETINEVVERLKSLSI